MDTKTKLNEAIPDLEHQLLPPPPLPTAADHKLTGCSCDCELARAACACASPATARTLALVTAAVGLAFAVDLAARGEHAVLALFAAVFLVACASSSLFAWCVGRNAEGGAWPGTAAARVLLWSFAMALVVTMTSEASVRAPRIAGSALYALGIAVGAVCFVQIVPFRGSLALAARVYGLTYAAYLCLCLMYG